jgi:hypothetical protein
MRECKHHAGYDCGRLPMPHSAVPENRIVAPAVKNITDGLTKAQVKAFRNLSEEEQRDYLSERLHAEAEIWLDYFMKTDLDGRLSSNFLTRPPQR